jgi:hypothetical protein
MKPFLLLVIIGCLLLLMSRKSSYEQSTLKQCPTNVIAQNNGYITGTDPGSSPSSVTTSEAVAKVAAQVVIPTASTSSGSPIVTSSNNVLEDLYSIYGKYGAVIPSTTNVVEPPVPDAVETPVTSTTSSDPCAAYNCAFDEQCVLYDGTPFCVWKG